MSVGQEVGIMRKNLRKRNIRIVVNINIIIRIRKNIMTSEILHRKKRSKMCFLLILEFLRKSQRKNLIRKVDFLQLKMNSLIRNKSLTNK